MSLFEALFGKPDMDPIFDGMSEADRKHEKKRVDFLTNAANHHKYQTEKSDQENEHAPESRKLETSVRWLANYFVWQIFAEAARLRPPSRINALQAALRATARQCMPLKRESKTLQKLIAMPEVKRLYPELSDEVLWNAIEAARDHERCRIDSIKRAINSGPAYLFVGGKLHRRLMEPQQHFNSVNEAWRTWEVSLSNAAWKTVECFVDDIDGNRILIFSYVMDPEGPRHNKKNDLWTPP
ncbi:hypothetical protein PUH89_05720 [Rhodobacter capsulatus]|uniref:Uncharacterized protein n=1 Tax=Rhodobacter capsulatus TaxID=1061 RepID=A0A1G7STA8_RHOCA|nr:hypothetical protein [Rhodobacter capsulatus]WER10481.1 hypothetical protein PUH89_05720 [Rhodobacter capsulatus]SDG26188.1 hypothetical protein SAMN04244550_03677 [Rhodobacter capsulatus]